MKGTSVPPLHTLLILEKTKGSTFNWEKAYWNIWMNFLIKLNTLAW